MNDAAPTAAQSATETRDIFPGDSRLARLMREHDWAKTPLGAAETWPAGLRIPLGMMLTSRFEMWLGWGPDLAFFYNDAYVPTLGVKHPHALGRPFKEVWREVYADIEDRVRSVIDDGIATWDRALLLLLERSGFPEETYHTFSYSPLRGDRGVVEGLMCVVTEETERVISERRLDTLRVLADALGDAIGRDEVLAGSRAALASNEKDFPFSLIYWRDDADGWTGHAAAAGNDGLVDHPWPLASAKGTATLRVALDGDDPVPCGAWTVPPREALVVPIGRASTEEPHGALVLGLNPYRPEDGEVAAFAQLLAGLIAGALAKVEAVELERRRADRAWAYSRDLIVVVDMHGIVRSVSPSWRDIIGHPPDDVVGRNVFDFVHPDDGGRSAAALSTAADENLTGFENRFLGVAGDVRWISWHTTQEHDLVYAYGRDVTEAKAQAEALHAAEDQLRQAQKMEAVGQLTGGLAHDFNNLLAGISGSLELMQSRISQGRLGDVERYLAAAQGASRRAAALTHRLLAFSRRQTLDPKPTNVNRLVSGMDDLVRRTVGPAIAMEVVGASGLWPALIDPSQLENALLNLCINARDAMPDGGRLTVETSNKWLDDRAAREHDMPPGQYLTLCVTDTGVGMPAEVVARAFDPFFTTKPLGEGTGLGLSMIYGFVRQSGGQVRIYSEPGQGTTVCLYLPRHYGREDEVDVPADINDVPRAEQGRSVLIVDDEPTVRMLVTEILQDVGYIALEAADSVSGLKILQSDARIDLLVTDVGLPGGMNGRQLADAGRAVRPGLKVLFITGYAENAVLGNGQLEPGMQVMTKPFVMEALASRINELVTTE